MDMEQIALVRTDTLDGDDFGNEWTLHYVLYRNEDHEGSPCFDIYEDDGAGNGVMLCRGWKESAMRSLILSLGDLVEWQKGVPLNRGSGASAAA
jgi:hypothetical protein